MSFETRRARNAGPAKMVAVPMFVRARLLAEIAKSEFLDAVS